MTLRRRRPARSPSRGRAPTTGRWGRLVAGRVDVVLRSSRPSSAGSSSPSRPRRTTPPAGPGAVTGPTTRRVTTPPAAVAAGTAPTTDGPGGGNAFAPPGRLRAVLLRMSTLFLRTLRDDPADAEVPSHRLLVRAGYIRRAAPGGFTWLPLGFRVFRNVERVVREEMDAMGAQEVHFPALLPREPYEATGRWTEYGAEPLPAAGPPGQRLPARPHARGDVHAPGEGPLLVLQGPAALALPDPDQVPRRGAAPRRAAPRPRVHDEGQLLLRRRRRRPGRLLRRAPRRLHQDLRPARPRLRDRLGDVGRDGRLEERGVPAPDRDRRGHLRPLARRLRGQRRGGHHRRPRRDPARRAARGARRGHPGHPDHRDARRRGASSCSRDDRATPPPSR